MPKRRLNALESTLDVADDERGLDANDAISGALERGITARVTASTLPVTRAIDLNHEALSGAGRMLRLRSRKPSKTVGQVPLDPATNDLPIDRKPRSDLLHLEILRREKHEPRTLNHPMLTASSANKRLRGFRFDANSMLCFSLIRSLQSDSYF